jgi:hypothetical protein
MIYKTQDVFGVRSSLIESYIERDSVDTRFKSALAGGNEIIVYGSSKQGKTSLILKHIATTDYVKVECSPQTQPIDIYKSILRQLNISFLESESNSESMEKNRDISGYAKVVIPILTSLGTTAKSGKSEKNQQTSNYKHIEYNLNLAQDISEILKNCTNTKYIVLENFHYLPSEVQEALSYDLRIFQDQHIIFIVLGIWREANRLAQFNGDLLDRITEVPVEPWEKDDFEQVIQKGSKLLNVDFTTIKDKLISDSFDSIGVVQEICKLACLAAGVKETSRDLVRLTQDHLKSAISIKSTDYGTRHTRNFESFVDIRAKTSAQSGKPSLAFPYYFIKLLLTKEFGEIHSGLTRSVLLEEIRQIHHRSEDVRSGDLGAFLHNLTQHQINKKIQPPFVDYDRGGKVMKIIDSSLYFFLKHCDREEILDDIPNPIHDS